MKPHDIRRLSVESRRDPRTVRNVIEGKPTKDLAEREIRAAAQRLGMEIPPPPRAA